MAQLDDISLLAQLVKGNHEAVRRRLTVPGFDFSRFIDFLAKHQLLGYVYSILATSPAADALPPDLLEPLKPFYIRQRTRSEQMVRDLTQLSSAFSLAGVEFILLKGPYLAKRFYGSLDQRVFWDIDILVKREELGRAQQVLTRNGYSRQSRILFNEQLTIYFSHAFEFAKPRVAVDLHWALKNRPSYNFDYQDIWQTKQEFYLDEAVFYVLSDQYALMFTLVSMFNDIEVAKPRLRSFVDLYMITKAIDGTVDWNRFLDDRKKENVSRISLHVLGLFLRILDCRGELPNLARAINLGRGFPGLNEAETIGKLITHSRVGLTHRMWASRLYEGSRLRLLLWWMISTPFRRAAFRAGKSARLKRVLRGLLRDSGLKG